MTDVKDIMAAAGVFKGADSLPKFVNKQEFWDKQPYSNRLYFGDNVDEYITRGHFQTAIEALTHLSEQNAKRLELDKTYIDTRGDFHSVYDELRASRNFLASEGYRRCDIAACNCLSWHDHGPQGYNGLRQKIEDLEEQNAAKDKEIAELRETKLSDLFLSNFPYEHWDFGDDENMRLGDWVHLGWQDHNGNDHSDGIGRICLHHQTEIPVILMVEGFEDDGDPHGTYSDMSYHPWNTIKRISEETARQALSLSEGKT